LRVKFAAAILCAQEDCVDENDFPNLEADGGPDAALTTVWQGTFHLRMKAPRRFFEFSRKSADGQTVSETHGQNPHR
jgi:hypothetical protein